MISLDNFFFLSSNNRFPSMHWFNTVVGTQHEERFSVAIQQHTINLLSSMTAVCTICHLPEQSPNKNPERALCYFWWNTAETQTRRIYTTPWLHWPVYTFDTCLFQVETSKHSYSDHSNKASEAQQRVISGCSHCLSSTWAFRLNKGLHSPFNTKGV